MNNNPFRFSDRRLIWSADGLTRDQITDIVKEPSFPRDKLAIKLDRLFFTKNSLDFIDVLQDSYAIPVFADAKIIEIPNKALSISEEYLKHKPWMLNVMAGACSTGITPEHLSDGKDYDFLYRFAQLCKNADTLSCAVTVLTSKTPDLVEAEFWADEVNQQVGFYADLMEACGLTDIVCSPQEAEYVHECNPQLHINTPGVRFADSSKDDQSRTKTPYEAIMCGADRLIIGRDIYRPGQSTETIVENCNKILAEIERAEADLKKNA